MGKPEEWRPVVGYEGFYEVSSLGRVRSLPRIVFQNGNSMHLVKRNVSGRILKSANSNKMKHQAVLLCALGGRKNSLVHRLVLEAFVGPCPDGMECCHNNGDGSDNRVENLRWDTRKSNHRDSMRHGTDCRGERNGRSKLTQFKVNIIRTILRDSGHVLGCARMLSRLFGVSDTTISDIKKGRIWNPVSL